MLCKGAEGHEEFDYCRACGFTVLAFDSDARPPEKGPLQHLSDVCRELVHPSPPDHPVNLTAITNQALKEGKVTFFGLPSASTPDRGAGKDNL